MDATKRGWKKTQAILRETWRFRPNARASPECVCRLSLFLQHNAIYFKLRQDIQFFSVEYIIFACFLKKNHKKCQI